MGKKRKFSTPEELKAYQAEHMRQLNRDLAFHTKKVIAIRTIRQKRKRNGNYAISPLWAKRRRERADRELREKGIPEGYEGLYRELRNKLKGQPKGQYIPSSTTIELVKLHARLDKTKAP